MPPAHWDAGAGKVRDDKALGAYFNEIIARDAAAESRRLALPPRAEDYKFEMPSDFKPPEGVKFELNVNDPLLAQARMIAKESGIDQATFSKLLGLYAGSQVASQQAITNARNAEVAKLGANGPARIDAITTVFKSTLGDADGAQLAARMFTAKDVEIAEKLVQRLTSQGGASMRTTGREPPADANRMTDEQVSKMSPAARLDWSRQQSQKKQMPDWRDPNSAAA